MATKKPLSVAAKVKPPTAQPFNKNEAVEKLRNAQRIIQQGLPIAAVPEIEAVINALNSANL